MAIGYLLQEGEGLQVPLAVDRGAQAGMEAAAAAALLSVVLPPLSGTAPMRMLLTVASNFPLSPLVALHVTASTSPTEY